MNLIPINGKILVKPDEAEKISKGGIHIPDTAKDKPVMGTVVAAAVDTGNIEKGDRVLYGKYAGTKVELDDKELIIMKETDILGYLRDEKTE